MSNGTLVTQSTVLITQNSSLMSEGVGLMIFGMGAVFIFLTLLVIVTNLMSSIISKHFPEPIITAPAKKARVAQAQQNSVDPQTLDAIKQAIHQYRSS